MQCCWDGLLVQYLGVMTSKMGMPSERRPIGMQLPRCAQVGDLIRVQTNLGWETVTVRLGDGHRGGSATKGSSKKARKKGRKTGKKGFKRSKKNMH